MNLIKAIYFSSRFFWCISIVMLLFVLSYFFPQLLIVSKLFFATIVIILSLDIFLLFVSSHALKAFRETPQKLSNGDSNSIYIVVRNGYPFTIMLTIIDELPFQFQKRDLAFQLSLSKNESRRIEYMLTPTQRGEYYFGALNVFCSSQIGFVKRRWVFSQNVMIPVYPSFLQMRKYEFMAIHHRLHEIGLKKIRKIGQAREFEQIKEYVRGDDYRTINWKATAKHHKVMVNQYQDERSQQVYNVIDMSRSMKMPFENMSLLDYAINSSLVLSTIAIQKYDKAGLIAFSNKIDHYLSAERKYSQMQKITESLYRLDTQFYESDFELLYVTIKKQINQRSLLIVYTNFDSMYALQRQLAYLKAISRYHLLVVVFFENTELKHVIKEEATDSMGVYNKVIAEKFAFEKRLIVKELSKYGIQSILTTPQNLTIDTLNKYLELKARGLI